MTVKREVMIIIKLDKRFVIRKFAKRRNDNGDHFTLINRY
jgi:hypothetical protein